MSISELDSRRAITEMQSVRQIARLNDLELEKCVPPNASWHTDYRDTAYIYIGGLPFDFSEGDILTIFSQYGNPVHVNLARDKETGKSRGFAWLKYEDQRSCDLAVDNLSGATVLGRTLSVDHARYQLKEGEVEGAGMESDRDGGADDTDKEGESRGKKRRKSESGGEEERRPMLREEVELAKLMSEHEDDDPMKKYLIEQKREEVAEAMKRLDVAKSSGKEKKHRHRHHRDEDGERRQEKHRSRRDRSDDEDKERRRKDKHRSRRDDDRDGDHRRSDKPRRDEDRENRNGHNRSKRDRSPDDEDKRPSDCRRRRRSDSD